MEKIPKYYGLNNHNLHESQKTDDVETQDVENNPNQYFSSKCGDLLDILEDYKQSNYKNEVRNNGKSDPDENYGYNILRYQDDYEDEDLFDDFEDEEEDEDEGEHEGRG